MQVQALLATWLCLLLTVTIAATLRFFQELARYCAPQTVTAGRTVETAAAAAATAGAAAGVAAAELAAIVDALEIASSFASLVAVALASVTPAYWYLPAVAAQVAVVAFATANFAIVATVKTVVLAGVSRAEAATAATFLEAKSSTAFVLEAAPAPVSNAQVGETVALAVVSAWVKHLATLEVIQ